MDIKKFEDLVAKRAHQNVLQRISELRKDVGDALRKFGVPVPVYANVMDRPIEDMRMWQILRVLTSENPQSGWPKWLWDEEVERVSGEVLDTMDAMQKMLIARDPGPDDCTPAPPPLPATPPPPPPAPAKAVPA